MPESSTSISFYAAPDLRSIPSLLDCVRIELKAARARGRVPIKLLVHSDNLPALVANAREAGELNENASPARILDLPLLLSDRLISAAEGARVVCEGDRTHMEIMARRAAEGASTGISL